ncbi:hypothetical protein Bca52824_029134 [Brassica carinata]|uniref:Uncharacterized protein n=1 Tax=Brassica carinata TaxID=52824 RepID=A0A8X7VDP5_BRACI|nr:hypothetical protein Bca52824_029134 [Brassica carinata]
MWHCTYDVSIAPESPRGAHKQAYQLPLRVSAPLSSSAMASHQEKKQLDKRAKKGETVVPGGRSFEVEAQQHLAEGLSYFMAP